MEDFDYIIKRLPPARICFGSSLPRLTLPLQSKLQSPLMRRVCAKPLITERFAEQLFSPDDALATSQCHCPVSSLLGWGPLASREPRFKATAVLAANKRSQGRAKGFALTTSAVELKARKIRPCWQPFGRSMRERDCSSTTPGPGTYTIHLRTLRIAGSFGGRRLLAPAVHNVCAPRSLATCIDCRRTPHGLYWLQRLKDRVLCRWCMTAERQRIRLERSRERRQRLENELDRYELARYCDFVHEHQNTTAKVQIGTTRELREQFRRENYLQMFLN